MFSPPHARRCNVRFFPQTHHHHRPLHRGSANRSSAGLELCGQDGVGVRLDPSVARAARGAYATAAAATATAAVTTNDTIGCGVGGRFEGDDVRASSPYDTSSSVWPSRCSPRTAAGATSVSVPAVLIPCDASTSAREVRLPCASDEWYLRAAADVLGAPDAFPHSRKVGDVRDVAHFSRKSGPRVIAGVWVSSYATVNTRASLLAGEEVRGDALLADAAPSFDTKLTGPGGEGSVRMAPVSVEARPIACSLE